MNLLQNSLKFTYKGGIYLEMSYDNFIQSVQCRVRDTGIGIKEEDLNKLFKIMPSMK